MDMDIVDMYQTNAYNLYMRLHPNANPEKVKHLINERVMRTYKDPPCKMDNNVTHETIDTTLSNAIRWIEQRNPIITGNGTFFKQHAEYLSPTVTMLEALGDDRSAEKKLMYQYEPGSIGYKNHYCGQINIKVIMNADYGGAGTTLSPFYSRYIPPATTGTAKNITTTLICCLELCSGNRDKWVCLNNINELFDFINIVLTDQEDRELDYSVNYYTPEQVANHLLEMIYCPSSYDRMIVHAFCKTLSDPDLYKLRMAYDVKEFIKVALPNEMDTISNYCKNHKLDIDKLNIADKKNPMYPEIEKNIADAGFGVKAPEDIRDVMNRVISLINDNCIYPFIPNDAETRAEHMQREVVCVTDTDSLMVHFAHFRETFNCDLPDDYRMSCIIAGAIGTRIYIEGIIPKFTKYIALGMNINDQKYRDKFIFKNEFTFLCMALFAKKMYAASTFVQEGSPRNIHKISVTGMSFKKRDAAEFLEPLMLGLYDKHVLTSKTIEVSAILDKYYETRNEIYNNCRKSAEYFKVLSLKSKDAYAKSKTLPAQMRGSFIWNAMFPDQEMLPMDRVKVIPLSWDLMKEHENDDSRIAECLKYCLLDDPIMKNDPYICLPNHFTTVPEWISPIIDVETLVDKLLSPFKQMLGLFNIHMVDTKGGMIPSRMVYW